MAKAAYPTTVEFALFLSGAKLLAETSVTEGATSSVVQALAYTGHLRVGDSLLFVSAGTIHEIDGIPSSLSVTLDAAVTTVTGERVIVIPAEWDLAGTLDAGISAFERLVGRKMIATTDSARIFDPPTRYTGMLDLREDLASVTAVYAGSGELQVTTGTTAAIQTFLQTGGLSAGQKVFFHGAGVVRTILSVDSATQITFTQSVTTTTGERAVLLSAYVQGTHYRLHPQNSPARGFPYSHVQIKTPHLYPLGWSSYQTLVIEGRWGYGTTLPTHAWRAMMALAGIELLPMIAFSITRGIRSYSEADLREEYGDKPLEGVRALWETVAMGAAKTYRRVTVGI